MWEMFEKAYKSLGPTGLLVIVMLVMFVRDKKSATKTAEDREVADRTAAAIRAAAEASEKSTILNALIHGDGNGNPGLKRINSKIDGLIKRLDAIDSRLEDGDVRFSKEDKTIADLDKHVRTLLEVVSGRPCIVNAPDCPVMDIPVILPRMHGQG